MSSRSAPTPMPNLSGSLLACAALLALSFLPACGAGLAGEAAPPSIVVVSLDTFRADRLGALGNTRGLTPNLDAFAREAVLFADTQSASNITSMSHASVFTSRYPSELGVVGPEFLLGKEPPTLASVLAAYGYDTAAFTGGTHMTSRFGLDRGFATFEAARDDASLWHSVPPALRWLDHRDPGRASFLLLHGYDAHSPYLKPAPYGLGWVEPGSHAVADTALRSWFGAELILDHWLFPDPSILSKVNERTRVRPWDAAGRAEIAALGPSAGAAPFGEADARAVRDAYDGAVAYADTLFGLFIEGLKARGMYERSTIVVMSDHGESLWEDGRFSHGDNLVDAELQVLLMIKAPGAAARRVDAPVSLLDLTPTLLELAGATPLAEAHGASLVPWLRGAEGPSHAVRFAEASGHMVSARGPRGRSTFTGVSPSSPYLVDLMAAAAPDGPAWTLEGDAAELQTTLLTWRRAIRLPSSARPADPAAVEAMRAQGYWAP